MKFKKTTRTYIAGHKGLVGSALLNYFQQAKFSKLITATKEELDLRNYDQTKDFFEIHKPEVVFLAAAKVGGIAANSMYPVEFLLDNLQIQTNIISLCYKYEIKKLIYLGSNCMYPKDCSQPMKEKDLFTGALEPTNEGYAIAKLSGLRLCQYYNREYGLDSLNVIPCSLYGPNDSFELGKSHVICAMIKKYCDAVVQSCNEVVLWGSGIAKREYMHVDDLVRAIIFLMENWTSSDPINIGPGTDISILELAEKISCLTGFEGRSVWDKSKPDGMLRKILDNSIIKNLGFKTQIDLDTGLEQMINIYKTK